MPSARRTAVFGGSFNPIHTGHLLLADEVQELLALDRVLFVPAALPPHKAPATLAAATDRLAMVALAVASHPHFEVSDIEIRRTGSSYTVDTLEELTLERESPESPPDELYLIIGSETFLDLLTWREPRRIATLARLVVVPRAGSLFDPESAAAQKVLREIGLEGFARVERGRPPARGVLIAHATSLPISASDLRARIREGRSLAYRMPDTVAAYVRARGLYAGEPRR